jgi:cytochrome c
MKKIAITLSLALSLAFAAAAFAADGKALYAKCAGCHGADGSKAAMSKPIKGMGAEAVAKALEGYKLKKFGGAKKSVMENLAAKLSADEIKALADYAGKF